MGIKVRRPCVVYEDNSAALKIVNNATAIKRTKHIDVRHHFLIEGTRQPRDHRHPSGVNQGTIGRRDDESVGHGTFPALPQLYHQRHWSDAHRQEDQILKGPPTKIR